MASRRFWGWGYEAEGPTEGELRAVEAGLRHFLGLSDVQRKPRPRLDAVSLPSGRVGTPPGTQGVFSVSPFDRASHAYGKSYRDLVRAVAGDFGAAPDLVAFPKDEAELLRVLECADAGDLAVIPYGGGSSVCGGVEPDVGSGFRGVVSVDLGRLDRVVEIDPTSRAARIQAGIFGPALEAELRPHGLSLRHYPQSFEFSSLGGWIATRSGGHYATLHTHIDEFVESLRVITPAGLVETRRLPGSGAGPDPNRLFIGSEGILGIITEAWMRVQQRPRFKSSVSVRFSGLQAGANAVRLLAQSGLHPANCRLLDSMESLLNGVGDGEQAILLVGFESADHSVEPGMRRALELVADAGGTASEPRVRDASEGDDPRAGAWKAAFMRAPYLRDELVLMGLFVETFETATTWDRFDGLVGAVLSAGRAAATETGGAGIVTCRVTHAYPDGAAPYFTVIAPARQGSELEQWAYIKKAMTDAMLAHGGTTTHHHAVGRDFRPYYDAERPPLFASALEAAKERLDPGGRMNPGVLLPARK